MSSAAQELLKAFEALPECEQEEVRDTLLYGYPDPGPLTDDALVEAAEELFLILDAEEEAANGDHIS